MYEWAVSYLRECSLQNFLRLSDIRATGRREGIKTDSEFIARLFLVSGRGLQ
jgi:hypothetical protein